MAHAHCRWLKTKSGSSGGKPDQAAESGEILEIVGYKVYSI